MQSSAVEKSWSLKEAVLTVRLSDDGRVAAISLLDGTVQLINLDNGEEKRITAHASGSPLSFCVDGDGENFLSAGDDGRVVHLGWHHAPTVLAEQKGKWIDHVAAHGKLRAYSCGKNVHIIGREEPLPHPSSVGGTAFSPNGKRLAASHYNGISLWWTASKDAKPQTLLWKGSHLGVVWHPSGDYVMTSMQENALHGWRIKDNPPGELRMAGYPGKIHSYGFSHRGKWLITSGADQIICWPFQGTGPQGKPPLALGVPEGAPVTAVSPHPKDDMTAAGYASGRVILALLEDRLPIELLPPDGNSVAALCWSNDGRNLITAHEDGTIRLFTNESIINASQAAAANPL